MRRFIIYNLLLIALIIQGCSATVEKKDIKTIIGVSVTQCFPIIATTGKVMNIDTSSIKIYYYQNQQLYIIGESYFPKTYDLNNPDTTYFSDTRNLVTRYYYFVYTKGNKYGYITDEYKKFNKARVPVDSVLKNQWFSRIDVYTNTTEAKSTVKVIFENRNVDSGILRKYFLVTPKVEGRPTATVYWEFTDRLKKIPYSFSPQLDSIFNSKLSKIKIVNFPMYFKENDFKMDTVKQSFDLEEIKNIDIGKIMPYFNVEKN